VRYFTKVGGLEREFRFERHGERLLAHSGDRTVELDLQPVGDGSLYSLVVDGRSYDVFVEHEPGAVVVGLLGERIRVAVEDERERVAHSLHAPGASGKHEVRASMPGIVVDVKVAAGDVVKPGQTLVVLEAMKMQNPLTADAAGKVVKVHAKKGVAVAAGALLIEVEGTG
jgi:biotin carboxyl carrier protein